MFLHGVNMDQKVLFFDISGRPLSIDNDLFFDILGKPSSVDFHEE